MRVDQDEMVEDETMLYGVQNKTFVPWLHGLCVTELDEFGEAKGATLAHELEQVLMSKFGDDQYRIRDEFNNKSHGFRAPKHIMSSLQQCPRVM